jgi:predicted permease
MRPSGPQQISFVKIINMKQTVIRYALYGTITILVLSILSFYVLSKFLDLDTMEAGGYLTMLISMIFVFFGLRHYRNEVNGGFLTFGQGLKLGSLIVLFPAIIFALFDVLYAFVLNPQWKYEYMNQYLAGLKATVPADKLAAREKEMREMMEFFSNPVIQFLVMFGTVFIIGFIVTIISTLALRRKDPVVAA